MKPIIIILSIVVLVLVFDAKVIGQTSMNRELTFTDDENLPISGRFYLHTASNCFWVCDTNWGELTKEGKVFVSMSESNALQIRSNNRLYSEFFHYQDLVSNSVIKMESKGVLDVRGSYKHLTGGKRTNLYLDVLGEENGTNKLIITSAMLPGLDRATNCLFTLSPGRYWLKFTDSKVSVSISNAFAVVNVKKKLTNIVNLAKIRTDMLLPNSTSFPSESNPPPPRMVQKLNSDYNSAGTNENSNSSTSSPSSPKPNTDRKATGD